MNRLLFHLSPYDNCVPLLVFPFLHAPYISATIKAYSLLFTMPDSMDDLFTGDAGGIQSVSVQEEQSPKNSPF